MKKIIFLLLIVNVCKAQYFNSSEDFSPINAKQYLKGNVKSVKSFFYTLTNFDTSQKNISAIIKINNQDYYYSGFNEDSFDVSSHLIARKQFNQFAKLLNVEKYSYNSSFKLISIKTTTDTNSFTTFEATYNNFIWEKELLGYANNGSVILKSVFYYKSKNQLDYVEQSDYIRNIITKEYYKIQNGIKTKTIKSIADKLLSKQVYTTDDTSLYTYYRSYNKDFDVVKIAEQRRIKNDIPFYKNYVKCYNKFGFDIAAIDTKYDSHKNLVYIKLFNKVEKKTWVESSEYKYDAVGNITEKIYINNQGEKYRISRFEFEYY